MARASQRSSENRPTRTTSLAPSVAKPKGLNLRVWTNSRFNGLSYHKRKLLKRLETENAELRHKALELMLQIQALRDGDRALTA